MRELSSSCADYVRVAYGTLLASTAAEITAAIPLCTTLPTLRDTGIEELLALNEIWANYAMEGQLRDGQLPTREIGPPGRVSTG